MSNFNAIHLRWFDPLTQQLKESIALVSPAENAANVCAFVGLAARAPNQLVMLSSAKPASAASAALGGSGKPSLAFNPARSAVDRFRSRAVFVPGAVPAATVSGRAMSLGDDLLSSLGLGGSRDAAQEEEGEEGEEEGAADK